MSSLPLIGITRNKVQLNQGETKVVHTVPLAAFDSLEYLISVKKTDLSVNRTFKMVVNRISSGLNDIVSHIIGNEINYSVHAIVNGSNAEIQIQNNESFSLEVNLKCEKI